MPARGAPRRQAWGCPQHPALRRGQLGAVARPENKALARLLWSPGEGAWAEPLAAALWVQMVLILAAFSAGKTDQLGAKSPF